MIDMSRPEAEPVPLPAFAPVPRQCKRHDGWTADRQLRFIQALADLGSVRAAAHAVNMAPEGAYLLRRHPEAGEFRAAWEAALGLGVQRLEDVAMDRALNGVEVPVYCYGKMIGTRRVYNDALVMFMLRNRAPKRFSADSNQTADAATKVQLERLKREWRQEWEVEQLANTPSVEEIRASLDRKVAEMRAQVEASVSPRARALHEEARLAQAEDEANGWRPGLAEDDGEDGEDGEEDWDE